MTIRNDKSNGTSWDSYAMESELGMYDCKFQYETLEWLVEKFSEHFGVSTPKVIRNNRIGNGKRRILFGRYRTYEEVIELSGGGQAIGFTIGTTLHEFCHHLNSKRGGQGHDWQFKRIHEEGLIAYDSDTVITPERLKMEEQLATLNLVNKDLYAKLVKETDTDEQLAERAKEILGEHWVLQHEIS